MKEHEHAAGLRALRDRLCIYRERRLILVVRVARVRTNDWGVWFRFEVAPTPGFERVDEARFTASAAWDVVHVHDRSVSATYVSWILVTRTDVVEQIMTAAAQGMQGDDLIGYFNQLTFGGTDS